jgi:hypothetical protein
MRLLFCFHLFSSLIQRVPFSPLCMEYMAQCQRTGSATRRLMRVASQMPGVEYALVLKVARTSFLKLVRAAYTYQRNCLGRILLMSSQITPHVTCVSPEVMITHWARTSTPSKHSGNMTRANIVSTTTISRCSRNNGINQPDLPSIVALLVAGINTAKMTRLTSSFW